MKSWMKLVASICIGLFLLSCGGNELLIPKPPTFLRTDFPKHEYASIEKGTPYTFELSKAYICKPVSFYGKWTDHKEIDLGKLNGVMYLNYYPIPNKDSLIRYVNLSNDKVDEHQIKATKINDQTISYPSKRVFGTFFALEGNVATNFQFYLTDSTDNFIRGEVLMNCRPNYDSLRPTLDYLKQDILHLFETFEWKK